MTKPTPKFRDPTGQDPLAVLASAMAAIWETVPLTHIVRAAMKEDKKP